jgi:hypothetical protein
VTRKLSIVFIAFFVRRFTYFHVALPQLAKIAFMSAQLTPPPSTSAPA